MSIRVNHYEQQLMNALQRQMSKREAENALLEIRASMYGDSYTQIHPTHRVNERGQTRDDYPTIKSIVWAYYNDGFEKLGYDMKYQEKSNQNPDKPMEKIIENCLQAFNIADIVQNNPHHFGSLYEHTKAVMNFIQKKRK